MTASKRKVLVLCTGNSCRSQMAEGFLRHYADGRAEIYSAGIEAHGVNPKAVSVMKEAGIDISGHTSNKVDEYSALSFDYIITVCDHARENCPYLPGPARRFHHNFPDPAKARGSQEQIMHEFRRTRDMIRDYAEEFARNYLN